MDESDRERILTTLVDHLDNGTTSDAGGIMRLPMSEYTCPQLLEQEQEVFFRKTPLLMGLSSQLPEPNTYWSDNATRTPILMVRDGEGRFRAYANVCRHRGSLVVPEGRGSRSRFTCPFHAWTYGNDGRLLSVNKSRQFGDVSELNLPLIELPAAEMSGTLWVRPSLGASLDEAECLGELKKDMVFWNLPEYTHAGQQVIDARLNWKLGVDSYGEIYHLNILHPDTAGREMHGNAQTFETFGRNLRMVFANKKIDLMRLTMPFQSTWPFKQITSTVYFFYPNTILLVDAFGMDLMRIFPLEDSPLKSRTIHTWYIDPKIKKHFEKYGMSYDDRLARFREIVEDQDFAMLQEVQLNAECGVQQEVIFGRNEAALQHFHTVYRSELDREPLPIEDG